jgi:gluconokinase
LNTRNVIVVMGVSGVGKTSVARDLCARVGGVFLEADDYHPAGNIAMMSAGIALTEAERLPWLRDLSVKLEECLSKTEDHVFLACSMLRRQHRDILRSKSADIAFVHLVGDEETILDRMRNRKDHFMPPALLRSQFMALEPPQSDEKALSFDVSNSLDTLVEQIHSSILFRRTGPKKVQT